MKDKKSEKSYFDYDGPFGFEETTSCNPDCKNLNESAKQPKKMSSKEMEEYFALMDAMEQDFENKFGKLDFKD